MAGLIEVPTSYKAWSIEKVGFEHLTLIERETPTNLQPFEILLKVRGASLNPVDYKATDWTDGLFSKSIPRGIGVDVSGTVVRIGESVDGTVFVPSVTGVFGHTRVIGKYGPLAEYTIVDSRYVTVIPQAVITSSKESYSDFASIPCAGFTAYEAVCVKLKIPLHTDPANIVNKQIKNIVVTAGAGGVGSFAIQLLRIWRENNFTEEQRKNVRIIATASKKNTEFVLKLGATHVVDYNDANLPNNIKNLLNANEQIDAWIDNVGQESTTEGLLEVLGYNGELVVVVDNADYKDRLFSKMLSVHNVCLGSAYTIGTERHRQSLVEFGNIFVQLYEQNQLIIQKTHITLEQVKDSLSQMKARHTVGKLVLTL